MQLGTDDAIVGPISAGEVTYRNKSVAQTLRSQLKFRWLDFLPCSLFWGQNIQTPPSFLQNEDNTDNGHKRRQDTDFVSCVFISLL